MSSPNYNTIFTPLSFARCYFSKVLNEDRILYIDADAIVIDNIQDLWKMDLEGNVIAGIHEGGEWDKYLGLKGFDDTYINSGVLLMDLKAIRQQGIDDKIIELLNTKKFHLPDQDVINIVCKDKIKQLSNIYNSTDTTGYTDKAKIVHYIRSAKGWIKGSPRWEVWNKWFIEMIKEGCNMENYKVKAKIGFTDYLGKEIAPENEHFDRQIGDIWNCSKERYLFLYEHNAVDLVEVEQIELPKVEELQKEPIKEEKKTTKRTTTKKITKKK